GGQAGVHRAPAPAPVRRLEHPAAKRPRVDRARTRRPIDRPPVHTAAGRHAGVHPAPAPAPSRRLDHPAARRPADRRRARPPRAHGSLAGRALSTAPPLPPLFVVFTTLPPASAVWPVLGLVVASTATLITSVAGRPVFTALQLAPPSVVLNTPTKSVPA